MFSKMGASALIKYVLPAILVGGLLAWAAVTSVNFLIGVGEDRIQTKWDADVIAHKEEMEDLRNEIALREGQHRDESRELRDRLAASSRRYAGELAALRAAHSVELRRSEERVLVYQRLAASGPSGGGDLAGYAAGLDRSLVEGRQVVEELRATLVERDRQLVLLGEQLAADRRLVNGP